MNVGKVANRLKTLRGNKTQQTVAHDVGISVSALTMYELGKRVPRDEVKVRLARYYGESVEKIFFAE